MAVEADRLGWPGDDWPVSYALPPVCQHPTCDTTYWIEGHHVVRRSATAGPRDFVTIDGLVVPNRVGLCKEHHDQLTGLVGGHKAAIVYPPAQGLTTGLYTAWWVWYAAAPVLAGGVPGMPPLPLKSGGVLEPLDYLKGVVLL